MPIKDSFWVVAGLFVVLIAVLLAMYLFGGELQAPPVISRNG
jgi:hypothetical protein